MAHHITMQDFLGCCGSTKFATEMARVGPFSSLSLAVETAHHIWWNKVDIPGWLEAFAAHPRIGDIEALRTKFTSESDFCEDEQATALNSSTEHILQELAEWNRQYEAKFGFIFLICATGKSSREILDIIKARFTNRPIMELQVAAAEQQKITELRLAKLLSMHPPGNSRYTTGSQVADRRMMQIDGHITSSGDATCNLGDSGSLADKGVATTISPSLRPPITTHVLDVALGRPGSGIDISLHWWTETSSPALEVNAEAHGVWAPVGKSVTNNDGRAGPLMPASNQIRPGRYRLTFNTGAYFVRTQSGLGGQDGSGGFYPYVMVVFEVKPSQVTEHFHVPILLSPFSFTTYRGS